MTMTSKLIDLFVIGGGINGAGMARDAAGRGLSVVLCEKGDLAEGTSSKSGKYIHGGLRYLEYLEFRLVREALTEREVLLKAAPHIIWPMRIVIPHSPQDRPAWLVRLGLFLYDHIGGRKVLPGTRVLNLRKAAAGAAMHEHHVKAFEYSDCWVDDARLVALNALDAANRGAGIFTRTEVVSAKRENGRWIITTRNHITGEVREFQARCLVNCAGPWVSDVIARVIRTNSSRGIRLVKGSHIITPKFWAGDQAYVLQHTDKRLIFVNPYQGDKALIGTTDIPFSGRAEDVAIDESEIDYLLAAVNRYFKPGISRADVLHTYSGVRPLFDDGKGNPSAVTRDYVFDLDETDATPLLNVFGGKITTFRELAERGLARIKHIFPHMGGPWTGSATLPGGDMQDANFALFLKTFGNEFSWLPGPLATHYARLYGTRAKDLIGAARSLEELGQHFGAQLYEVEARHLVEREWASTAEDILYRRTKHYVHLSKTQRDAFKDWFRQQTWR